MCWQWRQHEAQNHGTAFTWELCSQHQRKIKSKTTTQDTEDAIPWEQPTVHEKNSSCHATELHQELATAPAPPFSHWLEQMFLGAVRQGSWMITISVLPWVSISTETQRHIWSYWVENLKGCDGKTGICEPLIGQWSSRSCTGSWCGEVREQQELQEKMVCRDRHAMLRTVGPAEGSPQHLHRSQPDGAQLYS